MRELNRGDVFVYDGKNMRKVYGGAVFARLGGIVIKRAYDDITVRKADQDSFLMDEILDTTSQKGNKKQSVHSTLSET